MTDNLTLEELRELRGRITPGPWEHAPVTEGRHEIYSPGRNERTIPLIELRHDRDGHEPTRLIAAENARAISALPDLLDDLIRKTEALEKIAYRYDKSPMEYCAIAQQVLEDDDGT